MVLQINHVFYLEYGRIEAGEAQAGGVKAVLGYLEKSISLWELLYFLNEPRGLWCTEDGVA